MSESSFNGDDPPLLEDVVLKALQLPNEERLDFIECTLPEHPELRREVCDLVRLAEQQPSLLIAPDDPDIPARIDRFAIHRQCGRGGMGFVYEATDTSLNRRVALKFLPPHQESDKQALVRFEREAHLLASLAHTNIAVLYSKERYEGVDFLTMEFVEGETLAQRIQAGAVPVEVALEWFSQISSALEYAHSKGVIHLDLKPANIMLTDDDTVKVLDFGIARALQAADSESPSAFTPTRFTTLLGTPGYMSPEQLAQGKVDFRSDFWSFGVTLFECLTAAPDRSYSNPQEQPSPSHSPVNLDSLPVATPESIRVLIESCTNPTPELRPQTAASLRSTIERAQRKPDHHKRRSVAVLSMLILALGYIAYPLLRSEQIVSLERIPDLNQVQGLDDTGRTIWTWQAPSPLAGEAGAPAFLVTERSGDPLGVAVATLPTERPATLFFLDAKTGQPRWHHEASWTNPSNFSGPLHYRWAQQIWWQETDSPALVVAYRDGQFYSTAIQFIDPEGEVLGTYYHPGSLFLFGEFDTDGDGRKSLLFRGDNSSARFSRDVVPFETESHCAALILLDLDNIDGQAFPYAEGLPRQRDWPGMGPAVERAYLLIPPVRRASSYTMGASEMDASITPDGSIEFHVCTEDGRVFYLDAELRPTSYYVGLNSMLRKLPQWPNLPVPRCLYIRSGRQEYISVPRSD